MILRFVVVMIASICRYQIWVSFVTWGSLVQYSTVQLQYTQLDAGEDAHCIVQILKTSSLAPPRPLKMSTVEIWLNGVYNLQSLNSWSPQNDEPDVWLLTPAIWARNLGKETTPTCQTRAPDLNLIQRHGSHSPISGDHFFFPFGYVLQRRCKAELGFFFRSGHVILKTTRLALVLKEKCLQETKVSPRRRPGNGVALSYPAQSAIAENKRHSSHFFIWIELLTFLE